MYNIQKIYMFCMFIFFVEIELISVTNVAIVKHSVILVSWLFLLRIHIEMPPTLLSTPQTHRLELTYL